ncbi:unnamed protein product [Adineta ricciae]|uniref:Uncharacterized protein n=1 Tax=Adineta ricciae TaxID=249248 RepID=A0A814W837_ADIRI|nr:unnamed protein product [Adineta ricciae]
MSLALHAHQTLLVATFAFIIGVLVPCWYTSPNLQTTRTVFQVCNTTSSTCEWTLLPKSQLNSVTKILPLVAAAAAIACAGLSLISLFLGSWYIQRFSGDIGSKWLLVITIVTVLFSFILSCLVWVLMLTTNLYQNDTNTKEIRLQDFSFSFWINIGASSTYFYVFFIYLIAMCKSC